MKYIIKFKDFSTASEIAEKHKLRSVQSLSKLKMFIFEYDPYKDSTDLTMLRQEPNVKYVQPDEVVALDTPDEEDIQALDKTTTSESTYIANFSNGAEYYGHLELLNSVDYQTNTDNHDYSTLPGIDGDGVDIYVIDTGVNFAHPNLIGRVFRVPGFNANVDQTLDNDNHGHGTTSALCAAGTDCGVAQKARIYSLKTLKQNKSGSGADMISAMNSILVNVEVTNKPSICNLSLGIFPKSDRTNVMFDATGDDHYLNDGAKELVAAGVHVSIAAGNGFLGKTRDTNPTCTEGCDDTILLGPMQSTLGGGVLNLSKEYSGNNDAGQGDVVVVGATESRPGARKSDSVSGKMADFSNYGYGNTLNTSGDNMLIPKWDWGNPGADQDIWAWKSGTSFACPLVSGLMALRLNDVPNETPSDTKKWLVDSANYGNIPNLAKPLIVSGSMMFKWNSNSAQLTIEITESDAIGFDQHFSFNDVIQYYFDDTTITNNNYTTWKSEVFDYNDGWWIVKSVEDSKLVVESNMGLDSYMPIGSTTPILKDGADFEVNTSGELTIANISNTHEETDGVKYWQTLSDENILTGAGYRVKEVEYTDNLTAFNPYQEYSVDWGTTDNQKPRIVLPDALSNSPLREIKLKTTRNEIPFVTSISATDGLTGINVKENGELDAVDFSSKFNFDSDLSGTISLTITNGYKSVIETLDVVDNTSPPNILSSVKNLVWYGYCGAVDSFDLEETTQIHSVYQLKSNAFSGSLVWKYDVPSFISQPFTKLEPGHGYYIILKTSPATGNPIASIKIPNAVVSGVSLNNLEIGVC